MAEKILRQYADLWEKRLAKAQDANISEQDRRAVAFAAAAVRKDVDYFCASTIPRVYEAT